MKVRLVQIDGKLPNLALMKLAHWHKAQGDEVFFTHSVHQDLFCQRSDRIYASAIFSFSAPRVELLRKEFPEAIVGGTFDTNENRTVETLVGVEEYEHYDYSILPPERDGKVFSASIGFTARGCRLKCGFCVVPKKEGRPRSVNTIADIWRGEPWPKHLHLLDNDFFGQAPEQWKARLAEIKEGKFKVCFNQGINTRMITPESAAALASVDCRDDSFKEKRLYTAWDNLRDEERFFRGVDTLEAAGIPPKHLLVYMLIGYDPAETWDRIMYRFRRMAARGILPYPMVYGERNRRLEPDHLLYGKRTLGEFQRWVIRKYYKVISFDQYVSGAKDPLPNWRETAPIYSD
jgi:hypothetical protein